MNEKENDLDALLEENRRFEASETFKSNAVVSDRGLYDRANEDRLTFWESLG